MEPNDFKNALIDLYNIYNPSKKKEVDSLVKAYNGKEFDAFKTIILKYNYKGHPSYNENANRDEYINYIINSYSEGNKTISKEHLLKQTQEEELKKIQKLEEEETLKIEKSKKEKESILYVGEEVKQQIKKELDELYDNISLKLGKKIKEIDVFFENKKKEIEEKEYVIKEIQEKFLGNEDEKSKSHIKINIENLNFTDSDIELPSEEILDKLSKGSRLILKTSEGRVCGVEVKDVTYDLISYDGEIVKEIILEKI